MPTALLRRICLCGLGVACSIVLAACGATDQPAGAPSSPAAAQVATTVVEPTIAEPPTVALATSPAVPIVLATPPPTAVPKETTMPDQKPTQPISLGRATSQPVPEDATPANPPIAATPGAATAPAEIAKADLARRRAVAPETIQIIEVRNVIWPDPGMGCPQPGMAYKQVPVDGLLIRLESGGQIFEYHSGGNKAPFLCEQPAKGDKPTPAAGGESR